MSSGVIYEIVVNELLSSLHQGVLALGIFAVAFSNFRHAIQQPDYIKQAIFWQRLVLLSVITLFSSYIAITYFLEGEVVASLREIPEVMRGLSPSERRNARILVIVMLPIDLAGVICMTAYYMVLSRSENSDDRSSGVTESELERILLPLFLLTGVWHGLMVLWWAAYSGLGKRELALPDMSYHFVYALVHLMSAWAIVWLRRKFDTLRRTLEWIFFFNYVCLTFSVYVYRTYVYLGKYISV